MATKVAYIVGAGGSNGLSAAKSAGFIDWHHVTDNGVPGDSGNAGAASAAGMSYCVNWTNDGFDFNGVSGPVMSNQQIIDGINTAKSLGCQAIGGESETCGHAILAKGIMPWIDYGGGGLSPQTDYWSDAGYGFPCGSFPHVSYLETYENSTEQISVDAVVNAALDSKKYGGLEFGPMIGVWVHFGAQYYIDVLDGMAAQGLSPLALCVWAGRDDDVAAAIANTDWQGVMEQFPADTRQLNQRLGGGPTTCPDGSTPKKCPDGSTVCPPATCGQTPTGTAFSGFNEVDIIDYLTKQHNGQPTPGQHDVTITLG